jgi:hypothetical protein
MHGQIVDEVIERLKLFGHVPNASYVFHVGMSEEKAKALRYHSEKLTISFGINFKYIFRNYSQCWLRILQRTSVHINPIHTQLN